MLDLKGIDYSLVHVLPGNQRIHLRLAGFRAGTVPALKLDGHRIQGSTRIARELDTLAAEPPLYPADPEARRQVEAAERWGDTEFQAVPRRIFRWALTKDGGLRRWLADERVRRDVAELPAMLDRVDELVDAKVISRDRPNAATLQILCSVRSLLGFSDFEEQVGARSFLPLAREFFPHYPEAQIPPFVERLGLRQSAAAEL